MQKPTTNQMNALIDADSECAMLLRILYHTTPRCQCASRVKTECIAQCVVRFDQASILLVLHCIALHCIGGCWRLLLFGFGVGSMCLLGIFQEPSDGIIGQHTDECVLFFALVERHDTRNTRNIELLSHRAVSCSEFSSFTRCCPACWCMCVRNIPWQHPVPHRHRPCTLALQGMFPCAAFRALDRATHTVDTI
jgi:hypothetical protein